MANEVARAYVLIVPSMEGARGAISDELTGAGEEAGRSAGSRAGSAFSGALGAAARVGAAVVGAAAAGVTALTTQAVNSYADYEQLTGGIETLYGDAASQMMQYASDAAMSTGQSMNEFMETAIGSSAAMISSLGGDQQRAAELTNQAMIDMADNVNKLGTDAEMVQNAYAGFSRNNFTMLENLALGYSGSAAEMQRLLDDAQAISGVEYDISSYSDIVEAIHVVQDEMGIAGTTATEASQTVAGSLSALGASWNNLVTNFANPDADIGVLVGNLTSNAEVALANLMPVITNALSGMATAIGSLAPVISAQLPTLITNILPPLLNAAASLVEGLAQGLLVALPSLAPIAADLVVGLVEFVLTNLPLIIDSAIQMIVAIVNGISLALPRLIPAAVSAVTQVATSLIDNIDLILPAAIELCLAIGLGMVAAIPDMIAMLPQIGWAIITELVELGPALSEAASTWGADLIQSFVDGISGGIGRVRDAVINIADEVRSYLGFSEPEMGPLSNFHTYAPDMIDLFNEGLEDSSPSLEATLNRTLGVPSLGAMDSVSSFPSYEPAGDVGGNIVIPVNIGHERLDTIMIRSSQISTYRRGG